MQGYFLGNCTIIIGMMIVLLHPQNGKLRYRYKGERENNDQRNRRSLIMVTAGFHLGVVAGAFAPLAIVLPSFGICLPVSTLTGVWKHSANCWTF